MDLKSHGKHQHRASSTLNPPRTHQLAHEEFPNQGLTPLGSTRPHPTDSKMELNIGPAIWLGALHVLALAAPFYFSWSGLVLAIFLHWASGSLGICLGFHRLLTHTGLTVPKWLKWTFATIGTLAGEGGPISWTANHRKHHAFSDQVGDPHSPHDGGWWSHVFWLAYKTDGGDYDGYVRKWVPDLLKDKFLLGLEKHFLSIHIVFGAIITFAGYCVGGAYLATSWFLWAMAVRLVAILHTTWFVNSASHIWGYRNYETRDDSRNLWWVGLLAYGEGWHNNHHALPRLAQHGHRWWEFDSTYQFIRMLRFFGLAKDVVDLESLDAKKRKAILDRTINVDDEESQAA
jgi:fatty-acid desaturase